MNIYLLEKRDISKIVKIHRDYVIKCNSLVYSSAVVDEWLGQITSQSVENQLLNSSWYVAKEGETIIGFCQYNLDDGELYQIQVDPDYQGRGYGKNLYNFVEKDFNKHCKSKISLNSTLNAFSFYEKMGFRKVEDITFPLVNTNIKMVKMVKLISNDQATNELK